MNRSPLRKCALSIKAPHKSDYRCSDSLLYHVNAASSAELA